MVLAFARIRELTGFTQQHYDLPEGSGVGALWDRLIEVSPELAGLRVSTRVARNGTIVADDALLHDGDEVAFLPPVGGG